MEAIRIGCSGWQYADWRGILYPPGLAQRRWLERYAEAFDTVEVNATFYRLARRDAVAAWAQSTPPEFLFTVKASRFITHMKRLTDLEQAVARFYEPIEPLAEAGKLGPVLWQLPESFRRDDARLQAALECARPGRHAWEFRHPSWFCDEILSLLAEHGAALVIGDHPERPFQSYEFTAPWTLVRFHFGHRGRGGNYSDAEVREWAERILGWAREREVLAYFNNDWKGYAVRNALALRRLTAR